MNKFDELRQALADLGVRYFRSCWPNSKSTGRGYRTVDLFFRSSVRIVDNLELNDSLYLGPRHLKHTREEGLCSSIIEVRPKGRKLIRRAYKDELTVEFTIGDPARYRGWIPWYGKLGFIFECETTGGRLFFPWWWVPSDLEIV